MICKNCGNEVNENDSFCPKCGTLINKEVNNLEDNVIEQPVVPTPEPAAPAPAPVQEPVAPTVETSQGTIPPKKSKKKVWIIAIIIVVIVFVVSLICTLVFLLMKVFNSGDQLVCTSSLGNITLIFKNDELKGYITSGDITYNLEEQQILAKKYGGEEYRRQFEVFWYTAFNDGVCKYKKEEIKKEDVIKAISNPVDGIIEKSKKEMFYSTLTSIQDASSLYVISENPTIPENGLCITVDKLVSKGFLMRKGVLEGVVKITGDVYNLDYKLTVFDENYSVTDKQLSEISNDGNGFDEIKLTEVPEIENCVYNK